MYLILGTYLVYLVQILCKVYNQIDMAPISYHCFLKFSRPLNSFMTEVPIIQKPALWFGKQINELVFIWWVPPSWKLFIFIGTIYLTFEAKSRTELGLYLLIVYKMTDEWYIKWQRVTKNDDEWYNKWKRVAQQVKTSDK